MENITSHSRKTYLARLEMDGQAWTGDLPFHWVLTSIIPELIDYRRSLIPNRRRNRSGF